jgi:hypothetical protein
MKAKSRRKTSDTTPVTTRDSLLRSICERVASLALFRHAHLRRACRHKSVEQSL